MSELKLVGRLLRLKGMKVTSVAFKDYGRELHLGVKPYKNGARCVHCERRGRIVSQGKQV